MDDRVAEVLAERAALARSPSGGVMASAILHAAMIAGIIAAARSGGAPMPKQTVIMMRLAPAEKPAGRSTTADIQAAQPKQEAPLPLPKETPKPLEKPVDADLFGRSHLAATAAKPGPAKTPSSPASIATPAPGTAGVTAVEGGDFPYATYLDRMVSLIGTHWFRPQSAATPLARIYFVLQRDGSIRSDVTIEQSSGNATFDRAALRAVIESSPLPPLPYAYAGQYIGVHLTFH
jgi:TonB family protein